MAGVSTGGSRIAKHRKTTVLEYEKLEVGPVEVEAAIAQANKWIQQMAHGSIERLWKLRTPQGVNTSKGRNREVEFEARRMGEATAGGHWNNDVDGSRLARGDPAAARQIQLAQLFPWDQPIESI